MSNRPLIVFAGGGSGGHLLPALALMEYLRSHSDFAFQFLCTGREIDRSILTHWKVPFKSLPVSPLGRNPLGWPGFLRRWRRSVRSCHQAFRETSPAVVLGTGGFGSGPAVKVASTMGVPTALLNPDVIPGKANRYLAPRVTEIYVQWEATRRYLPPRYRIQVTGCPVRQGFLLPRGPADYERFQLQDNLRTLLVTGASLGARSINEAFLSILPDLADMACWQILHITGHDDYTRLRSAYNTVAVKHTVVAFTHEMSAAMRTADLVLTRAGAVTLAEIQAAAKPAILMPYPHHRDLHQKANAKILTDQGVACQLDDLATPEANAERLREILIPLMQQPEELDRMTTGYLKRPPVNGCELISQCLLRLVGERNIRHKTHK